MIFYLMNSIRNICITGEKVNQVLNGSGFQAKSFILPNLKKGIYLVKVTSSKSSIQKKLVVQ